VRSHAVGRRTVKRSAANVSSSLDIYTCRYGGDSSARSGHAPNIGHYPPAATRPQEFERTSAGTNYPPHARDQGDRLQGFVGQEFSQNATPFPRSRA